MLIYVCVCVYRIHIYLNSFLPVLHHTTDVTELKGMFCPSHPEVIRRGHVASLPRTNSACVLIVCWTKSIITAPNANMMKRISLPQFLWQAIAHTPSV